MRLTDLFKQNPNIIINTDIDGFLSGMILHTYLGCNIVGFSNSKEAIFVDPSVKDIYKPVYVDLFVNRPDVYCIEQHIIGIDEEHQEQLRKLGTKFNPNLTRSGRNFLEDYFHKYPFATVHYIIAHLESEGIHIELPDLHRTIAMTSIEGKTYYAELGQILLRADDAMYSSLRAYKDNAESWWNWLEGLSNNAQSIRDMIAYVHEQDPNQSAEKKKEVGEFFKKGFLCDGADGAFNSVVEYSTSLVLDRINVYAKVLCEEFGWHINIPMFYNVHRGDFLKRFTNPKTIDEVRRIINDPSMYSYAFIYGPHSKSQNFSYTLNMN